jgi:hypothetical protein
LDAKCKFVVNQLKVKVSHKEKLHEWLWNFPFEHQGRKLQQSFCFVFKKQEINDIAHT